MWADGTPADAAPRVTSSVVVASLRVIEPLAVGDVSARPGTGVQVPLPETDTAIDQSRGSVKWNAAFRSSPLPLAVTRAAPEPLNVMPSHASEAPDFRTTPVA